MKKIINRKINSIEGIINLIIGILGVKAGVSIKTMISACTNRKVRKERIMRLKQWDQQSSLNNKEYWYLAFEDMIKSSNNRLGFEMVEAFYNLRPIKIKDVNVCDSDIVIVCVVKNELTRMENWLQHYRSIGGNVKFAIVDNDSLDGTKEFLLAQEDVVLYTTKEVYSSERKNSWTNYVIADIGIYRWYLVADCDEFVAYDGMQDMPLSEFVNDLYHRKIYSVKSVMLDMYPRGVIGSSDIDINKFREEYIYYDKAESYSYDIDMRRVGGGFMERVFGETNSIRTKVPLFYVCNGRFMLSSHHVYPLYDDIVSPFLIILQHYKFLPGDEANIRKVIASGIYANGSRLYKKYVTLFENEDGVNVYYEGSKKWTGDESVREFLKEIEKIYQ